MNKLTIQRNNTTYEIVPFPDSTWNRVTKDGEPLALVMGNTTAFQVIYNEIGDGKFLNESDFKQVQIR